MNRSRRHLLALSRRVAAFAGSALLCAGLGGCATSPRPGGPPTSTLPPGPAPSRLFAARVLHKPPDLNASGAAASAQAIAFLDWACLSAPAERDDARRALSAARHNDDVARAFYDAALAAQGTDHTRALVALSLLGEMRNSAAEAWLRDFLRRPLPSGRAVVSGEVLEETALGTLQAKAVDGLAYLNTESANRAVLDVVARHGSRIVRAEAIDAYLWNQGDSQQARDMLRRYVRQGEEIFLDRVRREPEEPAHVFNKKLELYLKTHPDAVPPAPEHHREKPGGQPSSGPPPR